MRGTFTAVTTRPPGTPAPTGSYLAVTLDPTTFRVLDLGLSKHRPDVPLRSFGRVTSLTSVRLPRLAEHPVDQHRASRPRAHEHHVRQHHARPHHLGAIRKSRAHRRHAGVIVTRHHQIRPRPVRHPVRQPVVIVPRHRRPVTVPKPRPVLS